MARTFHACRECQRVIVPSSPDDTLFCPDHPTAIIDSFLQRNHPNRSSSAKTARAYVAAKAGVERVRITNNGEVHAYGRMPNSITTGWYFAGYVDDLAAEARAPE